MLKLGWTTAAIVPELAREIRTQNTDNYRANICWLETLTGIIETQQIYAHMNNDARQIINEWIDERAMIRLFR